MEGTNINEELDNRLQELIESHVSNLRADFRRLIGELPVHVEDPGDERETGNQQESLSRLKESVDAIHASAHQRQMAERLLDAAAVQARRVALFLMRGQVCVGFADRGFETPMETFDQVRITPQPEDPMRRAVAEGQTCHLHGSSLDQSALREWLGKGEPEQACLAPIVVGGQAVGLLYADSGVSDEGGSIHAEALDILTSVAGMFLERLRRPAAAAAGVEEGEAAEEETSGEDSSHTQVEDESTMVAASADADADEESLESSPESAQESTFEDSAATCSMAPEHEDPAATMAMPTDHGMEQSAVETPVEEALPDTGRVEVPDWAATQAVAEEPAETFDPSATVALSDMQEAADHPMPEAAALPNPDEPAEVVQATDGQEEDATPPEAAAAPEVDEKEEQARRFARLLVSEIVLYNEVQVKEGQKNADLLSRLKDPISRSREAYEQRFGRETLRYFDEEMVRTLAQGDPSLLGAQAG